MEEQKEARVAEVQFLNLSDISFADRIRKAFDEAKLKELTASIREYGIIQPIVVTRASQLVAGGRRLEALKRLGFARLEHAKNFVWSDETDALRLQAMELEENLRRSDLTWQEVVLGKRRLLEAMQRIHGVPVLGPPTAAEKKGAERPGFGLAKLSAMLCESEATTSQDLQLAEFVEKVPLIAQAETKSQAFAKLKTAAVVIGMQRAAAQAPTAPKADWTLHKCDLLDQKPKAEYDLIATDLPYAVDIDLLQKHDTQTKQFEDGRDYVLSHLGHWCQWMFGALRDDRFAVMFFGMNYYCELLAALRVAGFVVDVRPFIWVKGVGTGQSPYTRYTNGYEQALVAMKGSPKFVRPCQPNVFQAAPVQGKVHVAQKPTEVMARFILDMTAVGSIVCDPFAGSGTTGVACLQHGRKAVLYEREAGSWSLIESRMVLRR